MLKLLECPFARKLLIAGSAVYSRCFEQTFGMAEISA